MVILQSSFIIGFYHRRIGHGGRRMTNESIVLLPWNQWFQNVLIAENFEVKLQIEVEWPSRRVAKEEPPFSFCGIDMMGPFLVKEGWKIHMVWHNVHMLVWLCCRGNKQYDNWRFHSSTQDIQSVGEEILGLSKVTMVATLLEQALSWKGHSVKWTKIRSMTSWWNCK